MRVSTCLLPVHAPEQARSRWREAEELGFAGAYTYDHLSWREPFRGGPWFDAFGTLTLAATVTSRLRLGTLVTTPNFRHPVPLAQQVVTLDAVSGGRLTLGLGAGTDGFDAAVLGGPPLAPRRRMDRFEEFTALLDEVLESGEVTRPGEWFSAVDARVAPPCVQRPRVPFAIAGAGPRGLRLAAAFGQSWVTTGDPATFDGGTSADSRAAVAAQVRRLEEACHAVGRDPASIERVLLTGFLPERTTASLAAFEDVACAYAEVGITEIVVHAPLADTLFTMDQRVYEAIGEWAAGGAVTV